MLLSLGTTGYAEGVVADTVYVYKNSRGSTLITDHPRRIDGYTLLKRYGTSGESNDFSRPRPIDSRYDSLIDEAARRFRVDAALLKAVVHAESAFDPDAVSRKGAVGLTQLMPATALEVGVVDRNDPWQSLAGGALHLSRLLEKYGDTGLALAAYNAGAESVRRHRGIPPWPETRDYVRKVLQLRELYADG